MVEALKEAAGWWKEEAPGNHNGIENPTDRHICFFGRVHCIWKVRVDLILYRERIPISRYFVNDIVEIVRVHACGFTWRRVFSTQLVLEIRDERLSKMPHLLRGHDTRHRLPISFSRFFLGVQPSQGNVRCSKLIQTQLTRLVKLWWFGAGTPI